MAPLNRRTAATCVAVIVLMALTVGCSTRHGYTNSPRYPDAPGIAQNAAPPLAEGLTGGLTGASANGPVGAQVGAQAGGLAGAPVSPLTSPRAQDRLLATLDVDGRRGNPKVLMFLALSGGGSRSAYFATRTMLALERAVPGSDLLAEVDVISAVSGGSMAGAHYASTRDAAWWSPATAALLAAQPRDRVPAALDWSAERGEVSCREPLDAKSSALLDALPLLPPVRERMSTLCTQAARADLALWSAEAVSARMRRDYQSRWIANWFWPQNFVRYWTTSFDRADLMAQTLASNLFDSPILGRDLELGRLNPARPYLIVNATNASRWPSNAAEMPFGSVFTFTREDFDEHLRSDISSYTVARAVMGSSAFPVVFPAMTLADFRQAHCRYASPCETQSFVHVFDGGNSDNLGLKSVKRVLLKLAADERAGRIRPDDRYDRIVVLLVDAFTVPSGLARDKADPRSWFDRILDLNVIQATDSLLQANRRSLIDEFADGKLAWTDRDCASGTREYPVSLCNLLLARDMPREVDLTERMFFYHLGFADIERIDSALKRRLDAIPTAFKIDASAADDIDTAVAAAFRRNTCVDAMATLIALPQARPVDVASARQRCDDQLPPERQRGLKSK